MIQFNYSLKYIQQMFLSLLLILICIIMIISPQSSSEGVKSGIGYCINILIPSLFPFMFLSTFIVKSQIFPKHIKIISKIIKFVFFLPECTAPIILLSLIGGYPVGAKGIKTLFDNKEINKEQLNRMMCFCFNSGPGFAISVIGSVLLQNVFIGILIFSVQITLSILIGISCGIYSRKTNQIFYINSYKNANHNLKMSDIFTESATSACNSMMEMCSLILIFSIFVFLLNDFNIINLISKFLNRFNFSSEKCNAFINAFLEITSGCAKLAKINVNPALIAWTIGYGGICSHLQIISILKNSKFDFKKFFLFRLVNATLSCFATSILLNTTNLSSYVFSNLNTPITISNSSTIYGSTALILLSFYFIITVNYNSKFSKPLLTYHNKKSS